MQVIATIRTDFPTKFGIPRQSGIVDTLRAKIVFEPAYRNPDALRGLEDFSHVWLIWQFSGNARRETWSPTVRPPRLGGNTRMGVFATRSPFRPNPIGLSSVRIEGIQLHTEEGPVIWVSGADLMDGTPDLRHQAVYPVCGQSSGCKGRIYQRYERIHAGSHISRAAAGTGAGVTSRSPCAACSRMIRGRHISTIRSSVYGWEFAGMEIRFRVDGERLIVCSVAPIA